MSTPRVKLCGEERALILAALASKVKAEQDLVRAEFSGVYMAGSKQTFRSPLDDTLGYVQRTDPAPEWRVTDEAALREHLAGFPGVVETAVSVLVPGHGVLEVDPLDELVRVLDEHAPHMVHREERVPPDAIRAAVEESKATGVAVAPGITRVRPGGTLRVVPDKGAGDAVARMIAAGIVGWDGRPVLDAPTEQDGAA